MADFASIPGGSWEGTQGDDVFDADASLPGVLDNMLKAYGGSDYIEAGQGDDTVEGGNGKDTLFGGIGDDSIDGGNGKDELTGGEGDDTLFGGHAPDTFYFESDFGGDVVLDFKAGQDTLAIKSGINGLPVESAEDLANHVSGDATGAVISLGGDSITLSGVSPDDLLGNLDDYVKIV
jgi:Ca2+-binding RTX toxin-like protein